MEESQLTLFADVNGTIAIGTFLHKGQTPYGNINPQKSTSHGPTLHLVHRGTHTKPV